MTLALALIAHWLAPRADGEDSGRRTPRAPRRTDAHTVSRAPDTADPPDATIVAAIRAGDEAAFDALFRTHHARLVAFAAAMLGSADAADDAVAEVFQRIWARHHTWAPDGRIDRYLFLAVRNQVRTLVRDTRRAESRVNGLLAAGEIPGAGVAPPSPDAPVQADDLRTRVWALIDAMPEPRRAAAHLRWQEGMDYAEIARILGVSVGAVQMQLSRAIRSLRALIGE